MEVLKPGVPTEWSTDVECTGNGNGRFGCGALLRVVAADLRYYAGTDYPISRSPAVTVRCPECGKMSDLPRDQWPDRPYQLKEWNMAWSRGEEEQA